MISAEKASTPVSVACALLGVSRSGYYEWERRAPSDRALTDAWLIEKITEIWRAHRKVYGAPRIHADLRMAHGVRMGRKRVERLMREAAISGLQRRKRGRTTISVPGVRVADDLVERPVPPRRPGPAAGPQVRGQLALERSPALDEQRLIDRLMRDAPRLIIGEVQAQPARDLRRAPRPRPAAIPAATARPADPRDVRAAHRDTIGSLDNASEPVLDIAPQLIVDGELGRLGPPRPPVGMPLRGRRAIVKPAAASRGVASQLPRDRRR